MALIITTAGAAGAGVDTRVNDPTTDDAANDRTTQSETALVVGPAGEVCAGFNDFGPQGLSGFASSTDFGATWTDQGGLSERGDPVLTYHVASDTYYYASLGNQSIRVNASTDGCQTFGAAVNASIIFNAPTNTTTLADKPWIAVDNSGGANDGNLYICWTRFFDIDGDGNADRSQLRFARSTNGGTTWTNEQTLAGNAQSPFGCNVQVGNDGGVNVTWARRDNDNIAFRRSTNAGVSFGGEVTVNSAATREPGTDTIINCAPSGNARPSLTGNIRMLHQAWMAVDNSGGPNDGNLYIVWGSDPAGTPDNSDVFFSRSTDDGVTWSPMMQPGAGGGATDQFEPNVAVNDAGEVGVVWYDRRNDAANNTNIDVFTAFSIDGGATFQPIVRVTDVSFGVPQLNPNFNPGAANCYMGEYIAIDGAGGAFFYFWGDNRDTVTNANWPAGRPDPNVYFDVLQGPGILCPVGLVPTIVGTAGNDDLVGTAGNDVIFGLGGNDRIFGGGGSDIICGGDGNDQLYGGDGNDTLYGDAGSDIIHGGTGDDFLFAGGGTFDNLAGGDGADTLNTADGVVGDRFHGGDGVDTCTGDVGDTNLGGCP
ncbi:MAG: hypothetical protein ACRD0G_06685 [Acidimicrobiales bacterium]